MLMGGLFDLNSSQMYPDESLKESLKQIMLTQEIVFRKQVQELHRLYAIQKSLMKGNGCRPDPFARHIRCDFLPMERAFPQKVDFTRFVVDSNFSQKPSLPTGNRIWDSGDKSTALTHYFHDDNGLGEELNLSLSIGSSTNKISLIGREVWRHKITCPSPKVIINLEESTETTSSEDAKPVFPLDQCCESTNDLKKELSHGMIESFKNGGSMHQECSSLNQGSNEWHCGVKRSISLDLDLNKDQFDESFHNSNEPLEMYPSSGSSSGVFCSPNGKSVGGSSSPTPVSSKQPKSRVNEKDIGSNACTIDLESMPEPSSGLSEEDVAIPELREGREKENLLLDHSHGNQDTSTGGNPTEIDYLVQKAALSLICISLQGSSASNQASITRLGSNDIENEEEKAEKKRRIRCSSVDSYESLVLKLEESSIDEACASSKTFQINDMDKEKESGIKLRRGRRLKDFQKDILPTLSSLSRHEIWEDINIMEGVIRSREYKRLHRAKVGNAENWFTPVRSRRSKLRYVARRYCS